MIDACHAHVKQTDRQLPMLVGIQFVDSSLTHPHVFDD